MIKPPQLALILAALLWGIAVSATKYALGGFGPVTLLAISVLAATTGLWAGLLLLRGRPVVPALGRAFVLGLFEPALAYLGELMGLARTSAGDGALLSGLESAFVVILAALFLRERITGRIVAAVVLAGAGLVTIETAASFDGSGLGDLLVLGGMLSAAAYSIVARGMADDADPVAMTTCQFTAATLVISPVLAGVWLTRREAVPVSVAARFWVVAVLLGVLGYAVSFLLYNYAITRMNAGPASIVLNLIPVFGLAGAVVWLGESLSAGRVVGAALIGSSVVIFAVGEWRDSRAGSDTPAPHRGRQLTEAEHHGGGATRRNVPEPAATTRSTRSR